MIIWQSNSFSGVTYNLAGIFLKNGEPLTFRVDAHKEVVNDVFNSLANNYGIVFDKEDKEFIQAPQQKEEE